MSSAYFGMSSSLRWAAPRSSVMLSMPRCACSRMVPPGVSYMPRDFMPTNRCSTSSSRPSALEGRAAYELPFAPRRDHGDVGLQGVIGELEAYLVVALAGRAMGDGVGAGLLGDLDLLLGDQRPRNRGAEQIKPLILRIGAKHRE